MLAFLKRFELGYRQAGQAFQAKMVIAHRQ